MTSATARLDAFTDAAFAFAVSLMVVGTSGQVPDFAALLVTMNAIPSFAIGFTIIGMFWFAHVRWREFRGEGDWRSVLLTFALVFAVLVYVHPLRAMASSFAAFLGGQTDRYGGHVADMFAIYGIGFVVMSCLVCAMFREALRNPALGARRPAVEGESFIWLILATTGIASTVITQIPAIALFAPMLYATLPLTIGVFVRLWRWEES